MLSAAEWAVLALLAEGPTHGFAVARALDAQGAVGAIWTIRRPVVYRAVESLETKGLVAEAGVEASETGPPRRVLAITDDGAARLRSWLEDPVEHVRDARSLLMLKLLFHDRGGTDPRPLIDAQRVRFEQQLKALEARRDELSGFDRTAAAWRCATTRAAVDFLADLS